MTSVHRDGRHLVAVVLGGRSAAQRDARMRELINTNIRLASLQAHGGPIGRRAVETKTETRRARARRAAPAKAPARSRADPTPTGRP